MRCCVQAQSIKAELAAQAAESAGRVGEAVQAEITRAVRASETAQGQAAMLLEATMDGRIHAAEGRLQVRSSADGSVLFELGGDGDGDGFGAALAPALDFDGDGVPDLAAGALQANLGGAAHGAGYVRVLSGSGLSTLELFTGSTARDAFGASLAAAGDLNADGLADLLVGVPLEDTGGTDAGSALVLRGGPGSAVAAGFGSACAGFSGIEPAIEVAGTAVAGQPLALLVTGPPATPGLLILGNSATSWSGFDLPLDLGFAGLPGCALAVSNNLSFGVQTDAAGVATVVLPAQPAGTEFLAQAYLADADFAGLSTLGSMTGGLIVEVQP